jgi:predicted acyltransferase
MALSASFPAGRLASIDAYRGGVMLLMASNELAIPEVARKFPDSPLWQALAFQFSHVPWRGWALWDMIQPSFMFLVGVSMVFSYSGRQARGDTWGQMFRHAAVRALILTFLGVFLRSNGASQTYFTFEDVLSQIGLGYVFLFLLWDKSWKVQLAAALGILAAYWALFAFYPPRPAGFDYSTVGVAADWRRLQGFEAQWDKNTNPASDFDRWFLNRFPRKEPFEFNSGGYQTLSFIPSLGTMIFGLIAGHILRGPRTNWQKLGLLLLGGGLLIGAGLGLDAAGVCPLVKRIWTPSWALFSAGAAMAALGVFYGLVDLTGLRWAVWPLIVVGMNSIVVYLMHFLCDDWILATIRTHFGERPFGILGEPYAPLVERVLVLAVMWLVCVWLYRQKIFVRI